MACLVVGLRKSLAIFEDKNALLKTDFRFSLNFAQSFPKICQIKKEEMDNLLFMMDYVTEQLQISQFMIPAKEPLTTVKAQALPRAAIY
jgi:hypothetical protein